LTGAKFEGLLGAGREEADTLRLGAAFVAAVSAVAVNATLGLTLVAMRGAASDVLRELEGVTDEEAATVG
jgi:hypothetical protein